MGWDREGSVYVRQGEGRQVGGRIENVTWVEGGMTVGGCCACLA